LQKKNNLPDPSKPKPNASGCYCRKRCAAAFFMCKCKPKQARTTTTHPTHHCANAPTISSPPLEPRNEFDTADVAHENSSNVGKYRHCVCYAVVNFLPAEHQYGSFCTEFGTTSLDDLDIIIKENEKYKEDEEANNEFDAQYEYILK
jgi:hypothetical protein